MYDVIVIGAGPAGISAAIYALRGGLRVGVVRHLPGALDKAESIENYYGFPEPISGRELALRGIAQAERLGAEFIDDEIVGLDWMDGFSVSGIKGQYKSEAVVLATGSSRKPPEIDNFDKFDGHGISWCAVCDGFMCRGKEVAVLGSGDYAVHEAMELVNITKKVCILTDGEPSPNVPDERISVITDRISSFTGDALIDGVVFESGEKLPVFRVFIALGVAGSSELARKVGAIVDGSDIVTDKLMATNVPGLFAAGDCTGGLKQVSKAVYEGTQAGISALKYVRNNRRK